MNTVVWVAGVLLGLALLGYWGLHVRPKAFAPYPGRTPAFRLVALPGDLPGPVRRFFEVAVGEQVPVIESAVLSGRGALRIAGVRFPGRFRFTLLAGQGYRHYIEATVFGRPLFQVNEWYLEGHCRMELPVGVIANDPKTDVSANLGLWGETAFMAPVYLTDPRVRWEPIDASHARLVVPFGEGTDSFTVTFDAETGLIQRMEALRWKAPASPAKTLWRIDLSDWRRFDGVFAPASWALTWGDEKGPWFEATVEEAVYNSDVTEYIRAKGP